MYVNTPKRYRGSRRRNGLGCQRFLLWFVLIGLIAVGIGFYENRELLQPQIDEILATSVAQVSSRAATVSAPPPRPTTDPTIDLINGDNAWQRGDITNAMRAYEQIVPSVPNDVTVHSRLTHALLTRDDDQKAMRYAYQTVTADPYDSDAWATQAFAEAWVGDSQAAITSASMALELDPENHQAMAFLAYAYWNEDLVSSAQSLANDAIEAAPESYEGYWVLGIIQENSLLDSFSAQQSYATAYDLVQEQDAAMTGVVAAGLARTYWNLGNASQGVQILEDARAIDPDNTTLLYWLAVIQYAAIGDYPAATDAAEDCTRIAPDNFNCLYYLGRALDRDGDSVQALNAFERAVEAETTSARHYWWAANANISNGSCEDATTYLEVGWRMVTPGDLPAVDEGNEELTAAYRELMNTCRISTRSLPTVEPTPAGDENPVGEGDL